MSERYTAKDVRSLFVDGFAASARSAGFDPTLWVLQEGSPTHGHAYRVSYRDPHSGGLASLPFADFNGYIGTTAREAYMYLSALIHAWGTLADLLTGYITADGLRAY